MCILISVLTEARIEEVSPVTVQKWKSMMRPSLAKVSMQSIVIRLSSLKDVLHR